MKNQMTIPEQAVQVAKDVLYYANPNDVERAITAALPFLPVQGAAAARERALKEAVQVAEDYMRYDVAVAIRALSSPDHADAGKLVEGDGCPRCGGKGEIVVGKGRHGDTIIEDCPSCSTPQAEAIIAAKNATLQDAIECVKVLTEEKNKLEADNAALIHDLNRIKDHETELVNDNDALTARIKELEEALDSDPSGSDLWRYWSRKACETSQKYVDEVNRAEALEAKLAAAETALEPLAGIADLIDAETEGMAETDELVLHFHDYEFAKWPVSLFRKARAVLGGQKRPWEFKDDEHDL